MASDLFGRAGQVPRGPVVVGLFDSRADRDIVQGVVEALHHNREFSVLAQEHEQGIVARMFRGPRALPPSRYAPFESRGPGTAPAVAQNTRFDEWGTADAAQAAPGRESPWADVIRRMTERRQPPEPPPSAPVCSEEHARVCAFLDDVEDKVPNLEVNRGFRCGISLMAMRDPVVLADGICYERVCAERWLRRHPGTSPTTREQMAHSHATPVVAMRALMEDHALELATRALVHFERGMPLAPKCRLRNAEEMFNRARCALKTIQKPTRDASCQTPLPNPNGACRTPSRAPSRA